MVSEAPGNREVGGEKLLCGRTYKGATRHGGKTSRLRFDAEVWL
jgi:hypothetical protein